MIKLLDFQYFDLSLAGNIASIFGLFLTLYVFHAIWKIKNDYLFKLRVPSLLIDLKENASYISKVKGLLGNIKREKIEIKSTLGKIEIKLSSILKRIKSRDKKDIKNLKKNIKRNKSNITKEWLGEFYAELQKVITLIEELIKDKIME